jgi:hypothetical protein
MHGVEFAPFFESINSMEAARIPNCRQDEFFDEFI